jgi:hypothetical protein
VRAVFGDDQRLRWRQVEDLAGDIAGRGGRDQRLAASGAGLWIVVDGRIRAFAPPQRLTRMTFLAAGLLAGGLAQAAGAGRLLQAVARWRLAAVAAVQAEPAFQFGDARLQRGHLSGVTGLLRQKQRNEVVLGESDERGAIHRIFRIAVPPFVNRNFAPTRGSSGRPVASNSAVSVTPKPEAATTPGQLPIFASSWWVQIPQTSIGA